MSGDVERPTAAFVLSLIGGTFIVLVGLAVTAVGAALTFFIGRYGANFGLLGVLRGVLMIVGAVMLYTSP